MNVEGGTEAALFPEKEYINGIFLAVLPFIKGNITKTYDRLKENAYLRGCRDQCKS